MLREQLLAGYRARTRFPAGAWSQRPAPYQSTWGRPGSCPAEPDTETRREEASRVPGLYMGCNLAGPRGHEKKMQTACQMEGERGKYPSQRTSERAHTDIV